MFKNKRLEELKEDLLDVRARISRFMEGQTRVNDIVHEAFTHSPNIGIKRLHRDAIVPKYQTKGAAGMDIASVIDAEIKPGEHLLVPTGLAVEIEAGHVGYLFPRSGNAVKHGLTLSNAVGVIDEDFRGELKVPLYNAGKDTFKLSKGDRISQLVIMRLNQAVITETTELSNTERGEGGFGSSGIK